MNPAADLPTPSPGDLDAVPYVVRLRRNAVRLATLTVLAGVLAFLVVLLLPRWYRATATILPPDDTDMLSNLSLAHRALSKFPTFGTVGDYFTPADIYKATLKSRMAQEFVADRFDLQRVYRQKSREKTLKRLARLTQVRMSPDGTISVSVEDRDPRRAAGLAAAYLDALDRFNIEKRNAQARRTREFLENRVASTDSALRASEIELKLYQEKHAVVAPASAADADVSPLAGLIARRYMLEVRLGVLRGYLRDDNEQIVQTRAEIEQLRRRLEGFPQVRSDLQRLQRDNAVLEQLYLLLTGELEQARIQELRDTPTVTVLDPPVVPEKPSRPRRLVVAAAASLLACMGGLVVLGWREDLPWPGGSGA